MKQLFLYIFIVFLSKSSLGQSQTVRVLVREENHPVHRLDEVVVQALSAADLIKKAFSFFADDATTQGILVRQYLAKDGQYNKLSEGIGAVSLPANIRHIHATRGRLANARQVQLDIYAVCFQKEKQKTNAIYAFDPTELIIRSLSSDAVFASLSARDSSAVKLVADDQYLLISIEQPIDLNQQVQATWTLDRNSYRLMAASEIQHNSKTDETHRFEFEFISIDDKTYPYRAFHEHKKNGRKIAFVGGQELFLSQGHEWPTISVSGTFKPKRPDLTRYGEQQIDCAAVRRYMDENKLPILSDSPFHHVQ